MTAVISASEAQEYFLCPVADRSAATLIPIIEGAILPGTTIISRKCRAYWHIPDDIYEQLTVNHNLNFVIPANGAHTQSVESNWGLAKMRDKAALRHQPSFAFLSSCIVEDIELMTYLSEF